MTKVLGVKEAMQHFVSTLDGVETPATTIKKLTKQALDPNSENEKIQKARTIAEIWEQAAIGHGYRPKPDHDPYVATYSVETTLQQSGFAGGTLPNWFSDDEIVVTFQGETYTVPKKIIHLSGQDTDMIVYGDIFESGLPKFTEYPFCIASPVGGYPYDWKASFDTPEAGTYDITIMYYTKTDDAEPQYLNQKDYTLEITTSDPEGSFYSMVSDVYTDDKIGLVYNGKTYQLPRTTTTMSIGDMPVYGDWADGKPTFENCPIAVAPSNTMTSFIVQEAGTYTFSILYNTMSGESGGTGKPV